MSLRKRKFSLSEINYDKKRLKSQFETFNDDETLNDDDVLSIINDYISKLELIFKNNNNFLDKEKIHNKLKNTLIKNNNLISSYLNIFGRLLDYFNADKQLKLFTNEFKILSSLNNDINRLLKQEIKDNNSKSFFSKIFMNDILSDNEFLNKLLSILKFCIIKRKINITKANKSKLQYAIDYCNDNK